MALKDDINAIKAMEDNYFTMYGDYFETDNLTKISIPTTGSDAKIDKFTKFTPNNDKAPEVKETSFTPTAKDYRYLIAQIVFVNSAEGGYEAGKEKRAYKIIAERKNGLGTQVEQEIYYGGDQSVINDFTDGDESRTIPYTPGLDRSISHG